MYGKLQQDLQSQLESIPSKVVKGKRLPGHMGNERNTAKNLEVVKVDAEKNLLIILGAVPGANGGYVEVKKRVKGSK